MTTDVKTDIRNQYINEYLDAAGAKKPGLLGKIWRGVQKFEDAVNRWEKQQSWKMPATMLGVPVVMAYGLIGSFLAAPALGLVVLATGVTAVASYLRADVLVRREAWDTITKDIDDGKLSDRYKTEVIDVRARELEQTAANLPTKGAATAQFTTSSDATYTPPSSEAMPPAIVAFRNKLG